MGPDSPSRSRVATGGASIATVAAACATVPIVLALSGVFAVQVVAAASGAFATTVGFALGYVAWPGWRASDFRRLALATGFFLGCVGGILMLAGIGLYH